MPRQENTKEKILQCAFGLFRKPHMSDISLSEIAAEAGISKTAIFRHYKNKEDLLDKMRQSFFEALSEMLARLGNSRGTYTLKEVSNAVRSVFDFCAGHPNYLPYFMQMSFSDPLLTEGLSIVLQDNGFTLFNEEIFRDKKNYAPRNIVPSYFEQTLLIFLILGTNRRCDRFNISDFEKYKDCVARMIYSGLGKRKNPISAERKKALDKICELELEGDKDANRFLNAFVRLTQERGSSKITVEKIAQALGMAKSSVYAFFANKRDYLATMLFQETERVSSIIKEKGAAAKNPDEALYIMIRTQANYFALRPQVIMLHGYFLFQESALAEKNAEEFQKRAMEFFDGDYLAPFVPASFDFPVDNNPVLFVKWISGLTVGFMMMGTKYTFPPEWLDFYVSSVFEMVECGIKSIKIDGDML